MNKFILGRNPMRPDDPGLYVIHLLQPVAIFECIEGRATREGKITGLYHLRGQDGAEAEWTLSTHHFFTTDFLREPEDQVLPLMEKAWYWFKAYLLEHKHRPETTLSIAVPAYAQDRLRKKIEKVIKTDATMYRSPDADKVFCLYCGLWLVYPAKLTIEHIVPRSKGGNNSKHNTRPCCDFCNSWKGNKSLAYWKSEVQELLNERRTRIPYSSERLHRIVANVEAIEDELQKHPHLFYKNEAGLH